MTIETRRAPLSRPKKGSPPILSHEFVIQNHGDIVSSILMLIMVGFMFQRTMPIAQMFILPQLNENVTLPDQTEKVMYRSGVWDIPSILFYLGMWIAVNCALQEYVIDKVQRRLHLSKTRQVKFNESGQLAAFGIYAAIHAGYILYDLGIYRDVTILWNGYPNRHRFFSLSTKLFYLFQISYWGHQIPEFYFQKLRREEIVQRLSYVIPFFGAVSFAYFANFNRVGLVLLFLEYLSRSLFHLGRVVYFSGKVRSSWTAFKLWNILTPFIRLASIVVAVLTFWYGFRSIEVSYVDLAGGNFNTTVIRLNSLVLILAIQFYMVYEFAQFHLTHLRERSRAQGRNASTTAKKRPNATQAKTKKMKPVEEKNGVAETKKQK